ncbi:hypothetical protein B0J11DRAFT_432859 [Dendryphion nanum]|uniref:DUF6546 domain-containing protein n=1 Tax=Dendryphion nanum TaxID=256645 RepID=A0A9P9INY2_9PLEO|nr:hypothetical protein B0J11DRAFT_432859 [Dendryphion nanum]
MDWNSLAAELRDMILQTLIYEGNIARYASVCREWQATIEKSNFHSLKLTVRDIPVFGKLTIEHRGLVKYIWYSIELLNYDCTECDLHETESVMEVNQTTVKDGIRAMFCTLSKRPFDGDMTLDISIHSPSDSQHHFKYIEFEPANTLFSHGRPKSALHHDSGHSSSTPHPSIAAIDRIFPDIELVEGESNFWTSVPWVPCITHILLRRQTRRRWDPVNLSRITARLPNLRDMCFEPWREWGQMMQRHTDMLSAQFFTSLIPNKMKRLIIFEDLNETYISANSTGLNESLDAERIRLTSTKLTKKLAEASLDLQHFSAAFIIDARQYWEVCQPDWVWEQLLTLSLTSRDLVPQKAPKEINDLIYSAAQAIKKMTKLRTMELWNGGEGHAAMFRFKSARAGGCASIAWRGNWVLKFESRVVTAWENLLSPSQIRSHGEAILILDLENEVACPVSVQQIHREHF